MKCKICNSTCKEIRTDTDKKTYHSCKKCGYIFLDEEFFVSEATEKAHYAKHNNTLACKGYVKMFEDFVDFACSGLKIQKVLDYGAGSGENVLAHVLKNKGLHVKVFDRYFYSDDIVCDEKFDLVTCTEVIEHIANPKEFIKKIDLHVNKNGHIAIMTLFGGNEGFENWWYRRDVTHIGFFTLESLSRLMKGCDYRLIRSDNKRVAVFQKI